MIRIKADKYCNAITIWVEPHQPNNQLIDDSNLIEIGNINYSRDYNNMIDYMHISGPWESDFEIFDNMMNEYCPMLPVDMYNALRIFYGRKC